MKRDAWGREYLSNTEHNIVKEMRKNGYGSEEIFGVIGVHRQEEEARKQAAIQRKTDEKNAYMADASQGIIGGVDKDFKFHNTFGFLNDAGNFLTLKQNADDGFFESTGKMVANIP